MSDERGGLLKDLLAAGIGLLALVYLLNPTAGFLELIPDNFPIVGNLDEAGALLLLLNCLGYFGVDMSWLLRFFGGGRSGGKTVDHDRE